MSNSPLRKTDRPHTERDEIIARDKLRHPRGGLASDVPILFMRTPESDEPHFEAVGSHPDRSGLKGPGSLEMIETG